jgi:hypothetical protein
LSDLQILVGDRRTGPLFLSNENKIVQPHLNIHFRAIVSG